MDRFIDREDAGTRLAAALLPCAAQWPSPVVLGIPRGGVVVAEAVARRLAVPLDVLGVVKIGAPGNPELAVGAVGEGDVLWVDAAASPGADADYLRDAIVRKRAELACKLMEIRRVRPRIDLEGRTVIVVDDGIATGSTVRAALLALEKANPARRVLAVPVGPPSTLAGLAEVADDIVCLLQPQSFRAVGLWYDVFDQVSERWVLEALQRNVAPPGGRRDT